MEKIRPKNPVFVTLGVLLPWRYFNTFITLKDDIILIGRYFLHEIPHMTREVVEVKINDIEEIGFPEDLGIKMKEKSWTAAGGVYVSQGIDFKTKNSYVALNARPYTKKQIRYLFDYILKMNNKVKIGKSLCRFLNYNRYMFH